MIKVKYFILVLVIGISGCKRHKLKKSILDLSKVEEKKVEPATPIENTEVKKFSFEAPKIDFETCKIKSKISINSSKFKQTIPANIHVRKDSTIWISVSIGLEVARINIMPDTIQVLDRLNRDYYGTNFKQLSELFSFKVDFKLLQAALFGNLPIDVNPEDSYTEADTYLEIDQKRDSLKVINRYEKATKRLYMVEAIDNTIPGKLNVSYKNFTNANENWVPTLIEILFMNTLKNEKVQIDFDHSKLDFLDRDIRFPFNVPKGYDVKPLPGTKK